MLRRMKEQIGFTSLILLGFAAYGGYRAWEDYKAPYRLERADSAYYLVEKSTSRQKLITKDFQLGTPEYRLEGLMQESKDKVLEAIDTLVKKYGK